jgi:hypothetical protein
MVAVYVKSVADGKSWWILLALQCGHSLVYVKRRVETVRLGVCYRKYPRLWILDLCQGAHDVTKFLDPPDLRE